MKRLKYILNLLIIVILFVIVAIKRDGVVFRYSVDEIFTQTKETDNTPIETLLEDGTKVINSASLGKDVAGFGGYTPVSLYVKDGKVVRVEIGENNEDPVYLNTALDNGTISRWIGMSIEEVASSTPDAVSGATLSSVAIGHNIIKAAQYGANVTVSDSSANSSLNLSTIAGFLVILLGVMLTFVKAKQKWVRNVHLALNVVVLGFWCGSFLSISQFVSWASVGFNFAYILPITLLAVVALMPLCKKKGVYCASVCPMGSLQELASKANKRKVKIPQKALTVMGTLRTWILMAMLLLMWLGVGFDIMNYEVFSAFIFGSASTVVLIIGTVFVVLSLFVNRPYCRFVCPTGALLAMSYNYDKKQ